MTHRFFNHRTAALATIHAKEKIIAPLFVQALGLNIRVADVNTDLFGTFTGEIERKGTQQEAARLKCMAAITQTGLDIGLASEGSFGPHPKIPFVASDYEIVMLKDTALGIEVCGQHLTAETNFAQQNVSSADEALLFADSVGFPSHGLIVSGKCLVKGIRDYEHLIRAVSDALKEQAIVQIQTDMRAMHNPTRCRAIAAAAQDLIERLQTLCPACGKPGFGKEAPILGLPCTWCGLPTHQTKGYTMHCPACQYTEEIIDQHLNGADPSYCLFCNP